MLVLSSPQLMYRAIVYSSILEARRWQWRCVGSHIPRVSRIVAVYAIRCAKCMLDCGYDLDTLCDCSSTVLGTNTPIQPVPHEVRYFVIVQIHHTTVLSHSEICFNLSLVELDELLAHLPIKSRRDSRREKEEAHYINLQ